jgi:hypothetical protein
VGRYLPQAILLTALVTGLCAWPAHAWGGRLGLVALGVAGAMALTGAVVAHLVGRLLERMGTGPEAGAQGAQAAIAVRMVLTLGMSLPVFILEPVPPMQFAAWLGAHYLVQMVLEVFVSVRELSQNHAPTGTTARASQPEETLPSGPIAGTAPTSAEGAKNR